MQFLSKVIEKVSKKVKYKKNEQIKIFCTTKVLIYIIILWGMYLLYLTKYGMIRQFPILSLAPLTAAVFQILLLVIFDKLLFKRYSNAIKLTSLLCCLLLIFWQYMLLPYIYLMIIFSVFMPALVSIFTYFSSKSEIEISFGKYLGVTFLLSFGNIIGGLVAYYILYYWVLINYV
jgi:hypothetical protein